LLTVLSLILSGCYAPKNRVNISKAADGIHVFINDEEYAEHTVESLQSPTIWNVLNRVKREKLGVFEEDGVIYEIYQYEDSPHLFVMDTPKFLGKIGIGVPGMHNLAKKDFIYPELTTEAITGVNIVDFQSAECLRAEHNTDVETIAKVLKIINGSPQTTDITELQIVREEYDLILASDALPNCVAWHVILKKDDQYFIRISREKEYSIIPKELLEEVVGGPLPAEVGYQH
jgi:hypothetical protein